MNQFLFCKMVIIIISMQSLWLLSDSKGYKTLNTGGEHVSTQ